MNMSEAACVKMPRGRIECNAEEWIKGEPNEELVQIIKAGFHELKLRFRIYGIFYSKTENRSLKKPVKPMICFTKLQPQAPAKPVKNTVALLLSPKRRLKGKKVPQRFPLLSLSHAFFSTGLKAKTKAHKKN